MYETNIKWLKEISDHEVLDVGYKAHVLSELIKANISVPRGFVINYKNFFNFIQKEGLKEKINEIIKKINFKDKDNILENSNQIKKLILKTKFDDDFISDILKMYIKIGESKVGFMNTKVDEFVAIRVSVSSEEYPLKELDFIEQQIGFLNIKGRENIIESIKECWADLYNPEILEYKYKKGFEDNKINLSIIIQKMIPGKKSGIMLTSKEDNKDITVIEAVHGFGGKSILKELTPDHYEISKSKLVTIKKTKANQEWMLKRLVGKTTKVLVDQKDNDKQKLDQRDLNELTEISKKLELIYGNPLEINWVMDSNDEIFIISANPINLDLKKIKKRKKIDITTYQEKMDTFKKDLILEGIGVSNGISIGQVKIVRNTKDLADIDENTIFVTKMTSLEMSQILRKAKGIITDAGSTICHAALIAKKYDVPCVVHTEYATTQLRDGQSVLVNGFNGKVYSVSGYVAPPKKPKSEEIKRDNEISIEKINKDPEYPKTITKTIVKINSLKEINEINIADIDGIILTIDSIFTSYEKGNMLENLNLLIPNIKSKLKTIIKVFEDKEIYYKINTHASNLMTENVSSYELEAIINFKRKINILLENIKSIDEIISIKENTESKIGILIESLKENIITEYISKGIEFIVFNLEEIDYPKLKEIIKVCKENKILRISEINSKNTITDVKSLIDININGLIINNNQIEFKDVIYKKEREMLKNLLSI
jgi:phosphoenolpyruvate synthase/pyruvate phosphate dikinase